MCFHQYFGSSLNLNVHLHMLVLDGVYVTEQADRQASAASPSPSEARTSRLCAESGWFTLHAGVRIRARDRAGLERLCRYVTRPPLSHPRLSATPDGNLLLALKTPWRDGTSHLVLTPTELLERLAAIIPPARSHLVTYHGVLAPASPMRSAIVPGRASKNGACEHGGSRPGERWIPWAVLLARSFELDAMRCPGCHGRLAVRQIVRGVWVAGRLLEFLLPAAGPDNGLFAARPKPEPRQSA